MANFIPEEDREAKATDFEQLKQGNQRYDINFSRKMTAFFSVVGFAKTPSSYSQSHVEQHSQQQGLYGTYKRQHSGQYKLGFHGCYLCGDIGHIKANCPKSRRNFNGGSTRPFSSSATIVTPPQACGYHNQTEHGADRGADRVTEGMRQPRLFATLDRQSAEAFVEVIKCILLVCSHNAYSIIDPGSTFSYVTPYFEIHLGLEPE
uniref:CCHC-type domain-containing protein n=1 Tax=Nicotiana tabacum TaxID=4097 RepID=A0A1S4A920_TOBAC|nr:PREDICTED: uncharacterized protein LOC107795083 [Nicotiana tabacum]